jgi:hypothetical protein
MLSVLLLEATMLPEKDSPQDDLSVHEAARDSARRVTGTDDGKNQGIYGL